MSPGGGFHTVAELATLRRILIKLRCEDIDDFDASVQEWTRGAYVRLSDERAGFSGSA